MEPPARSFADRSTADRPATGPYVGRFAPSPTGPLHFGSLVAATASYADARARNGRWLLRIEDLDPPRESREAAAAFPLTLERYGFEWDGPIVLQSARGEVYADALEALIQGGRAFPCSCTRSDLAHASIGAGGERIYPGTCRTHVPAVPARSGTGVDVLAGPAGSRAGLGSVADPAVRHARAWRVRVDDAMIAFDDRIQGHYAQHLGRDVGDFIVRRADGLWAYQLAVVVDDRDQGVTDVVRGADLLASTPRQILLQRLLGAPTPRYAHVPVAVDAQGQKLSKQTLAAPIPASGSVPDLVAAWRFLDQAAPESSPATAREFWTWAIPRWDIQRVAPGPKPAPSRGTV